jgi:septum formation protein
MDQRSRSTNGRAVVLASASPRRRELLRWLVPEFRVMPSDVDETLPPGPLADAIAGLALDKARAVAPAASAAVVLAADTMVVIDGEALGKPADPTEAGAMLRRLRGREHEVMTGVAVIDAARGDASAATEVSRVLMARYPDDLVDRYVASGAPLDKAGGYAVQDLGGVLVDAVIGSYTNVVGLPLAEALAMLKGLGWRPPS